MDLRRLPDAPSNSANVLRTEVLNLNAWLTKYQGARRQIALRAEITAHILQKQNNTNQQAL